MDITSECIENPIPHIDDDDEEGDLLFMKEEEKSAVAEDSLMMMTTMKTTQTSETSSTHTVCVVETREKTTYASASCVVDSMNRSATTTTSSGSSSIIDQILTASDGGEEESFEDDSKHYLDSDIQLVTQDLEFLDGHHVGQHDGHRQEEGAEVVVGDDADWHVLVDTTTTGNLEATDARSPDTDELTRPWPISAEASDGDSAADKPDYGLNEIPSLKNIKSRFESSDTENGHDTSVTTVQVKRSESIASKMAKFQGTHSPDDGIQNDSSSSDEEDDVNQDSEVAKECKKSKKEKVVFSGMSELKSQWEAVSTSTKEERARERQEELAKLRLRLCHGKGNIKAMYESACEESSGKSPTRLEQVPVNGDIRTSSIKEKFERGDVINDVEYEKVEKMQREKQEDLSVFEQGSAIDARNLFKKMDSSVKTATPTLATTPTNNVKRSPSMRSREVLGAQSTTVVDGEIVKATDKVEDDLPVSLDVSSKFKFFENYQDLQGTPERKRFTMTPPREPVKEPSPETEIARDPNIVRCCDREEEVIVTDTARKMLNKFRELEYQADHEEAPVGPKPLKRITPPREYTKDTESPEPELPRDPNIVRACDKIEDDFLIEAHKARNLKQKFEHWDVESDVERENRRNVDEELLQQSPETAKNLKAKFEALNEEQGVQTLERDRPKSKINRFI